jgi:Zinc carboxypeptidase/Carboxypeptidase activation peptide
MVWVICTLSSSYKVYNVTPQTDEHVQLLARWHQMEGVDFWDGFHRQTAMRIMIQPDLQSTFEKELSQWEVSSSVLIENVEQSFRQERRANFLNLRAASNTSDFNRFWTLGEIYAYAEDLARRFSYVNTVNLTKTSEGRVLKAVTIAANGTVGKNPVVLIDAGIHAREWAAVMSAVYLLRQLTEKASENPELLKVDWVIFPVANPDGYVYSHEKDRLWRKNRSLQSRGCYGVDLNRNFGLEWRSANGTVSRKTPHRKIYVHIFKFFRSAHLPSRALKHFPKSKQKQSAIWLRNTTPASIPTWLSTLMATMSFTRTVTASTI